ncbi:MAG: hypothetical protein IKK93_07330 [Campylobacter sp.]|nr:hypothetical protein [Campylobacter sp.]
MNKEIYAQSTFNNQANGSIFYKEGKLNDPMLGNVNGIFQSWKYSFDTGKQIFRATDSDKVYEKRLLKDPNGNPKWSTWVEICPGEANGIQAIAINNQPLLLPNEDGAIRLQITPQMIDTYTKREIYDMINSKLDEIETSGYINVHWVDGCNTPKEVLEATFPDGGELSRFYLVDPKPEEGVANTSTYWYYNDQGEWRVLDNLPNLNAFVSQVAFNEHTQDKLIHVTAEDRERWNNQATASEATLAAVDGKIEELQNSVSDEITNVQNAIAEANTQVENAIAGVQQSIEEARTEFEDHTNDINKPNSPHITPEEREKLLHAYDNLKDMPDEPGRFVIENKNYVKDYFQYETDKDVKNQLVKTTNTVTFRNGDAVIAFNEHFQNFYDEIRNRGNSLNNLKIDFNNIIIPLNVTWQLEADNGWTSEVYGSINQSVTVTIPANKLPEVLHIKLSNTDSSVTFGSTSYNVEYYKKTALNLGDTDGALPLNLVGPENVIPTYNGVPLNEITGEITGAAHWGKITGNLDLQQDLIQKVNELVKTKVENPESGEPYRYDIYGNGTLKSIIQNIGNEDVEIVEISNGTLRENRILVEGVRAKVNALKSAGYFVTNIKLVAENIACTNNADGEIIPVYFETDNINYEPSPSVVGPFNYNWPAKPDFDKIYLRKEKVEYITNAHLEISYVSFSDIEIGLLNEITNKFYNMSISAEDFEVNAENINLTANDEIDVLAKIISLGNAARYNDQKTEKVLVYGEEIDQRYASREVFETEDASNKERINDLNDEVVELNARVTAAEDRVSSAISDIDAKSAEIDGQLADFQEQINEANSRIDSLDETVRASVEDLLRADADNAEGDATIFGRVTALEEDVENIHSDIAEITEDFVRKDELSETIADKTRETFDLIIGTSGEFTEALRSGAFEQSERILFHKGLYEITDSSLYGKVIDFTNIKYVKGEIPCSINCTDNAQVSPVNFELTKFENIDIKINDFVIEKEGTRTLEINAEGSTFIDLLEYYDTIKVNLVDDAEITIAGGLDRKEYILEIAQPLEVKNVKFTNFFVNDNSGVEFFNGLENQKPGNKTLICLIADNKVAKDAFIIKYVIYGALEGTNTDGLIKVSAKNITCELYKSSLREQAVTFDEDEVIGYYRPGTSFVLNPSIVDGFAHNSIGYDYTVESSNGIVIGHGKCDEETMFTVPITLSEDDEIFINFNVEPQLVSIELDPEYANYITANHRGFTTIQTVYGQASIQFNMKNHFFAYGYQKDDESPVYMTQESLPWEFTVPARASRENFTIYIRPLFVAMYDDFDFETVSTYGFDKSSVCLSGYNTFNIRGRLPQSILNDPNYGRLYNQALLTLFDMDGVSNGSIELDPSGKSQTMTADISSSLAGGMITFNFGLPNGESITKEMYVASIDNFFISSETIKTELEGKYVLDTYVNENREYSFVANLGDSGVINDYSGKWTISDESVLGIHEIEDNHIIVQAKKIGIVTLSFKSNFTGLTASITIEVVTHAKAVSGPENMVVKQLTEFTPRLKWYDFNDNICDASEVSITSGRFVETSAPVSETDEISDWLNSGYLNDSYGNYLIITDKPLDSPSVEVYYRYQADDSWTESITSKITIVPVELLISFSTENENITGVRVFNVDYLTNELSEYNCKAHPDSIVTFIITLKTGETLPEQSIQAMEAAFGTNAIRILNVSGRATIDIAMPYHPVTFVL